MSEAKTFDELCRQVESIADASGMFSHEPAEVPNGFLRVGWYCSDCGQLLVARNIGGHRAGTKNGYLQSECSTSAEKLVPMFILPAGESATPKGDAES